MARSPEECDKEIADLNQAHALNETGRDSFLALAHTALFAASIAFVGEVTPVGEIRVPVLLATAWLSNVIGLLALTFSFQVARNYIDQRRAHIYDDVEPRSPAIEILNTIALWSFPVALISLAAFTTTNVLAPMPKRHIPAGRTGIQGGVVPAPRMPTMTVKEIVERGITPPARTPAKPVVSPTAAPTPAPQQSDLIPSKTKD